MAKILDKEYQKIELLKKIEGLQTVEMVASALNIKKQSAINLLSKLKKEGHVKKSGGGKQVRFYKITVTKQYPRDPGMFDVLNKYSPNMKLAEWYDHQVHGVYGPEEALIDAIQTGSFRAILASMRLFNHITDWKKLYQLAKQHDCWQKIGALYDVSKRFFRCRQIPKIYLQGKFIKRVYLINQYQTKEEMFYLIEKRWNVSIPFRKNDIRKVIEG